MSTRPRREDFRPFRLAVDYFPAQDAPIKPLIEGLSFIRSKIALGRRLPLRLPSRARGRFRAHRRRHGPQTSRGFSGPPLPHAGVTAFAPPRRRHRRAILFMIVAADLLVVRRHPRPPTVDHQRVGDRVLALAVHGAVRRRRAARHAWPRDAARRLAVGRPGLMSGLFLAGTFFFFIALADAHDASPTRSC